MEQCSKLNVCFLGIIQCDITEFKLQKADAEKGRKAMKMRRAWRKGRSYLEELWNEIRHPRNFVIVDLVLGL